MPLHSMGMLLEFMATQVTPCYPNRSFETKSSFIVPVVTAVPSDFGHARLGLGPNPAGFQPPGGCVVLDWDRLQQLY
jgi:hypothetical protein